MTTRWTVSGTRRSQRTARALLLAGSLLFGLACSTLSTLPSMLVRLKAASPTTTETAFSSPTPEDTPTPQSTETWTPTPAETEAIPLSATPTAWVPPLVSLPTARSPLSCKLNWQSPRNHVIYNKGDSFTVGWSVMNTGTTTWSPGTVEFTYVSGAKLQAEPLVSLKSSVGTGQSVVLSVGMRAPRNSTTYTTHWSLRMGDTYFCPLSLWIYVQ